MKPLDVTTAKAYTARIAVGTFYTDGERVVEVRRVYPLGHIQMEDLSTGELLCAGIAQFRTFWWRVW